MRRFTRFSFGLIAVALALPALHAADKDLPPGLQKKDQLPPGLQKKEQLPPGLEKRQVPDAAPATPVPPAATPGTPAKAQVPERSAKAVKADIDQRITAVNTLDNKPAVRRAGVAAIVKETGTSEKVIENLRKEFPEIGTGGLLIATELAAKTKKPAANFVRQRVEGKSWTRIAAEHDVNLETIDAKLNRVEEAMRKAK